MMTFIVSVLFIAAAVAVLALAIIAPESGVSTMMVSTAAALICAVAVNGFIVYGSESSVILSTSKRDVKPTRCPDYWTTSYDPCIKSLKCDPTFVTVDGDTWKTTEISLSGFALKNEANRPPGDLCSARGNYPWVELDNLCKVRTGVI